MQGSYSSGLVFVTLETFVYGALFVPPPVLSLLVGGVPLV